MRLTLNQLLLATKNHLLAVLSFFCLLTAVHAQNIPNANFAAAIRATCSLCIDAGNNLLPPATTLSTLNVSNRTISDLTGIGGFTTLTTLDCSQNQLTSLPALPPSLRSLNANYNNLTTLPSLPSGLTNLSLLSNQLTSLPASLPSGLITFNCYYNNAISTLPNLPNSLQNLYCGGTAISTLPNLPSGLRTLSCAYTRITSLPSVLPTGLVNLFCDGLGLTSIPSPLPNVTNLGCGYNRLTSLPTISSAVTYIACNNNFLTSLPNTLSRVTFLNCSYNQIAEIPPVPSMVYLYCENNQLSNLPSIPTTLQYLNCYGNQIRSLPVLPTSMVQLRLDPALTTCLPNAITGTVYNKSGAAIPSFPVCAGTACSPSIAVSPVIVSTVTQTSCIGAPLSLSASALAVGTVPMTVKWQRKKPSDADFIDVTTAVSYISGTSVSYIVPAISAEDNSTQYRAVFSGTCANAVAIGSAPASVATREGLNIPDLYFRNAILRDCPTCINNCGNLTTDAEKIVRLNLDDAASFQYISDLTGIEGFVNLEELNISNNSIKIFPSLPEQLKKLMITNNKLTELPNLPSTVEVLI
jgi:Leucine-rich repeat (LRR) protein